MDKIANNLERDVTQNLVDENCMKSNNDHACDPVRTVSASTNERLSKNKRVWSSLDEIERNVGRDPVADSHVEEIGSINDVCDPVRTVVDSTKERLRRIKGHVSGCLFDPTNIFKQFTSHCFDILLLEQVFHVIDNNQLLLLRIGTDGQILERFPIVAD